MSDVKSKNLYELLGNDVDQDEDAPAPPPVKVKDKPAPRTGKRDAPGAAPSEARAAPAGGERGGRGGRRGGPAGSEGAYRDREAGSSYNRGRPTDDTQRPDRGGRGGRGERGRRRGGDRHTRGLPNEHDKQADQSWGAPTGESEWKDEQAGEAIAQAEEKAEGAAGGWTPGDIPPLDDEVDGGEKKLGEGDGPDGDSGALKEPEDNSRSFADYEAELLEKKLKLGGGVPEARKPNEGSKLDKKWQSAKPIAKESEDSDYFRGQGDKAKRERQRKEKNVLEVDMRYVEPSSGRGGGERGGERGRGRGGRGSGERGEFRGGRGRGGPGRGEGYRGGRGGEYRGRGRGESRSVNVADENAFPSLGGS